MNIGVKHIIDKLIPTIATITMAAIVGGCFTGIESTPKITGADVRKSNLAMSEEDNYFDSAEAQNISIWQVGKKFIVTDSRIALAMALNPIGSKLEKGDTLRFERVADITSIMGKPVAEFVFSGSDGTTAVYDAEASVAELGKMNGVRVPFTVELSRVEAVRDKMRGKEYYTLTSEWNDMDRKPRRGRKFVRVKAVDVQPGNESYPVCVTFAQATDTFTMMMSLDKGLADARRFSTLLSLSDPRSRYPAISDANWMLIQNGKVTEGMTRPEVRLSLGKPDNVERRPGYSVLQEIWTYADGRFLLFEDGLLKNSRL